MTDGVDLGALRQSRSCIRAAQNNCSAWHYEEGRCAVDLEA